MGKVLDNRGDRIEATFSSSTTPDLFKDALQYKINEDFSSASNIYAIQEETGIGTGLWQNITVRIGHVIEPSTGINLGDDWRNIIFSDLSHFRAVGYKYQFDSLTWLTFNTDYYKYATANSIVRRSNYNLKWYNDVGKLITEPCIFDYWKFTPNNNVKEEKYMRTGDSVRYIYLQSNTETRKLKRDKRFIVDGRAYRIVDFDTITKNGLIELTLDEHQVNQNTDDLINFIADALEQPAYTVVINNADVSFSIGNTVQIDYDVKFAGKIVTDKTVSFESSDITKCTVNSTGLITGISNGSAVISASLTDNDLIYDTLNVTVASTPTSQTTQVIEGNDSIALGMSMMYQIYHYINGVSNGDTYSFSLSNSYASILYSTGNTVSIKAAKTKDVSVVLTAINNNTAEVITKTINISALW